MLSVKCNTVKARWTVVWKKKIVLQLQANQVVNPEKTCLMLYASFFLSYEKPPTKLLAQNQSVNIDYSESIPSF